MKKQVSLIFIIVTGILAFASAPLVFAVDDQTSNLSPTANFSEGDSVITQVIKKKLEMDPRVSSPSADVTTVNGVVSLKGTFADRAEVAAAIEDIASTSGTQDIDVSQVVLSTGIDPTFSDLVIEARIRGEYIQGQIFGPDPITVVTVESKDGVVFLTGAVNDIAQKERAIDIASKIPNVKKVIPNIRTKF